MVYDVAVVGAGPAGTTAARELALRGASVLLLERDTMPRIKPCGGALTHRALDLLPSGSEVFLREHPREWTFQGFGLEAVTLTRPTPYCHVVERQYFDQFLAKKAAQAGAAVHDGEPVVSILPDADGVTVTTIHQKYRSRYVIAADGAHGRSWRQAGLSRPRHGAAIEAEVDASPALWERYRGRVEIHVGRYSWGYAWVIPRDGVLNIGVGSFRAERLPLKQRFYEFVEEITGHRDVTPRAHPLPYRLRYASPVVGRVLCAGDAAGLMDAFSAEGIYSALKSGKMAAHTVASVLEGHGQLASYGSAVHGEFWPQLKSAVKMGLLFYPLAGFWSRFFSKNHGLLNDYLDVAMGIQPYQVLQKHTERALLGERGPGFTALR